MTLAVGDHLVIKRNGKIIEPKDEAYHEYEVMSGLEKDGKEVPYISFSEALNSQYFPKRSCSVKLEVVE